VGDCDSPKLEYSGSITNPNDQFPFICPARSWSRLLALFVETRPISRDCYYFAIICTKKQALIMTNFNILITSDIVCPVSLSLGTPRNSPFSEESEMC